ncbi:MAG: glycosyltransferase family 2 protein [Advenella sp.]|uniref:glycosyltransferase family 2 protein n=1 Tax=Advenella sp. TaxID=1872388 RepID=UPI003F9B26F0
MHNSLISIILPAYNAQDFIASAIESVLEQTYPNLELIVVDDGSTDQTRLIIESYKQKDERLLVVSNEQNSGVAYARNTGLRHARGDYIAFIDSDDTWRKEKLLVQHRFMNSLSVPLSYTAYDRYENGSYLNTVVPPEHADYALLLNGNCIGLSTVMLQRGLIDDISFVNTGHEDYIFWLDIFRRKNIVARCVLPTSQPWVRYNVHDGSLSANKFKALLWQWQIYRKVLGLGVIQSACYLFRYAIQAVRKRI